MAPRRLQVAVSGLGRMGARHALHFLERTPRAELVAAFTPDPKEVAWAKLKLEPSGVKIYTDYEEMLKHPGLEAVVVATVTTMHAPQAIRAIESGKHVLCEKPLSTSVEIVRYCNALSLPTSCFLLRLHPCIRIKMLSPANYKTHADLLLPHSLKKSSMPLKPALTSK